MTSMTDRLLIVAWHNVERTWHYPAAAGGGIAGFERQLRRLRRLGTVVPLARALRLLSTGQPLPPRAIALTFDDGYRDNLELGAPVLERLGLPATFFLVPGILSGMVRPWWEEIAWALARTPRTTVEWDGRRLPVGGRPGRQSREWLTERLKELDEAARRRAVAELLERLEPDGQLDHMELFLDWDGARELVRRGFSVGAHSMEHAILARETPAAQLTDLVESRRCLEAELGVAVDLLAYPNGTRSDYDTATVEAARSAGYAHALTARTGNVFATYEWASSWWRHHGQGHSPLVTACRSADGRLVAILPLYRWSAGPLQILRFIGHGAADQLGPIHAAEDRDQAAALAREVLAKLEWDMFVGEQLPARDLWSGTLGAGVIRREGSPVLRAPAGGWPEYLARRSPNFRQQLGRRERNLARRHHVAFRLVRDPGQLPAAMDQLFRLHQLRWDGAGSAFLHRAAFHRDFAATALERGWIRLWLLELDGRPAAAWYGFRFGNVESYYQSGRDPAFDRLSAGFVLLAHTIRAAFDDGAAEYRFGRGQDPYKYRFTDEDPGLETIASTRGPAAGAALFAARRAYPLAKQRIGRLRWELT
jgi:peptidoglycan/xylan/chitin deacetylase (PgdA/CDA1 family)